VYRAGNQVYQVSLRGFRDAALMLLTAETTDLARPSKRYAWMGKTYLPRHALNLTPSNTLFKLPAIYFVTSASEKAGDSELAFLVAGTID
jgi:hypothetical protein